MLLLLRINQIKIQYSQAELVELGLQSAAGTITEDEFEQMDYQTSSGIVT